jgi:hypothetical protein
MLIDWQQSLSLKHLADLSARGILMLPDPKLEASLEKVGKMVV